MQQEELTEPCWGRMEWGHVSAVTIVMSPLLLLLQATDSSSSAAGSSTAAGSSSSTAAGSSSSSTAAGSSSEQAPSPRPSPRPGQARDALGGDLFCSLMAAINFKLPSESLRAVSGCDKALHKLAGGVELAGPARRPLPLVIASSNRLMCSTVWLPRRLACTATCL